MKNNISLKIYSLTFFLFATLSAFAADPEEAPEDLDGTAAPIGDYIWIVAVIGFIYIFMKYKSKMARVNS